METNFHYPAEYYDEDYTIGIPDRGDILFYLKYARQQGSPVLELACGTGRILVPVAQTGIECYGLISGRLEFINYGCHILPQRYSVMYFHNLLC